MIWSGLLAAFWVLAATVTAFLPMKRQMLPGIALLVAAPILIFWLGHDFGWLVAALAVAAFASMFRNPLIHLIARARGQNPALPPELLE
ncbi:DUF2484 family protein [Loktanella sp. DJP18]|uniref:DUF2484 family protein n=1 Tax=Loktanella sp. DJP18 TaxID=3409788 RepID=UPI003BB58C0D